MYFESPIDTWTSANNDVHSIFLTEPVTVPIKIWLTAKSIQVNGTTKSLEDIASSEIARANLLFNWNNTGIQFAPVEVQDISPNDAALTKVSGGCGDQAGVAELKDSQWYEASAINVYYVSSAYTGTNCNHDRNMIYIGSNADAESLTHELGHAFGLAPPNGSGHVNGLAGFGTNNIMWPNGPGFRTDFTLGQSYRFNMDQNSVLNQPGRRSGIILNCLQLIDSTVCPPLALDLLPH
jgi:hypothetical protein